MSKTAEDVVIKIVEAIETNDTAALKTTLNLVFGNIAALQKEHSALKAELNELKKQKQSDYVTVRLTVPSTVADPALKDAKGQPTLGIKHMTTAGHEERLDQIQKQAADKAGVFDGTAYLAAGEGVGAGEDKGVGVGEDQCEGKLMSLTAPHTWPQDATNS